MPELFELYEIQRFLPLPYEAAVEPRLRKAQERMQGGGPGLEWVRVPEEGTALLRLHALAGSIRAQGRTLLVVEESGLERGVRGVAGCLGLETGAVCFLSGLPSPEELRRALELAAYGDVSLCAAGGEDTPAFRLLQEALAERYGETAERYILGAGGREAGPNGASGLFSPPGLLALAVSGVDAAALLAGAAGARRLCRAASFENPAWRYAAVRRQLSRSGFSVELLCTWDSALRPLLEWAGGLFAGRALFSAAVDYSRERRALDPYIREGPRVLFETVVRLEAAQEDPAPRRLREAVMEGTLRDHTDKGVPNLILRPGGKTAEALGGLAYFFQYARALSACLLDGDCFPSPEAEEPRPLRPALWDRDWRREAPPGPAAAFSGWGAGGGIL